MEHCAKLDQVHLVITFFQIKRQYVNIFILTPNSDVYLGPLPNIYDEALLQTLLTVKCC